MNLNEKITHILNLPDLKILILDKRTHFLISLIPKSSFYESKYFLFENIENKLRTRLDLHCVIFISMNYIQLLYDELLNPKYTFYTIYFVNKIDTQILQTLAKNDIYNKVINIYEFNYNLYKEDENLYLTKEQDLYKKTESIQSLLDTLNISPKIIHQPNFEKTELNLISHSIDLNKKKKGTLFLLNRSIDKITPLLFPWRYQELIKLYFNYENRLIEYKNKKYEIDLFFENNKFLDIFSVSKNLKTESKKIQVNKSIYEKKSLEIHLMLVDEIIKKSLRYSDFSENEINIIKTKKIDQNLNTKNIKKLEEFKMEIIYFYRTKKINNPKYEKVVKKYVKENPMINISKYFSKYFTFDKNLDIKIGQKGRIYKIIKNFLKNCLSEKFFVKNFNSITLPIIIYLNSSLSYGEYFQICNLFTERNISLENVYVVCEDVCTYESLLKAYIPLIIDI